MREGRFALLLLILVRSLECGEGVNSTLDGLICQEKNTFGYKYINFYNLEEDMRKHDGIHFSFKVRTPSDAHILLSNTNSKTDQSYEIVIGAGKNTFTYIRRGVGSSAVVRESLHGLLSSQEIRGFWITIFKEGGVFVGKEGDDFPFISLSDSTPNHLQYFSFSSWNNVYGKWYFNCRNITAKKVEEEKILAKPLTMTEKLRQDLLNNYDPEIAPQSTDSFGQERTVVNAHLITKHVHLNEKKSILNVHGIMKLFWIDGNLKWTPSNYGNLTSVALNKYESWLPDLKLYNNELQMVSPGFLDATANMSDRNIYNKAVTEKPGIGICISASSPAYMDGNGLNDVNVIVSSNGKVFWSPLAHFEAFCKEVDLRKWPKDTQICELQLGFWSQGHHLQLNIWKNWTYNAYLEEEITGTEWEVVDVISQTSWIRTPWANKEIDIEVGIPLFEDDSLLNDTKPTKENFLPSSATVKFTLIRRNSGYYSVLLVPITMVMISILLSFCASPFGTSKLAFQCLSLITTALFLVTTSNTLPAHADYIPSLISAYRIIMVMVCISMVSTVAVINFTRCTPTIEFYPMMQEMLTSKWVSFLFILPTNESEASMVYTKIDDEQPRKEIFERIIISSNGKSQWNWFLLSTIIDRVMFFIYIILFLYIFSVFL